MSNQSKPNKELEAELRELSQMYQTGKQLLLDLERDINSTFTDKGKKIKQQIRDSLTRVEERRKEIKSEIVNRRIEAYFSILPKEFKPT